MCFCQLFLGKNIKYGLLSNRHGCYTWCFLLFYPFFLRFITIQLLICTYTCQEIFQNNILNSPNKQVIGTDEPKSSQQEFEDINVELSKIPGKGLGLSVVGRRDGCGVFISDMVSVVIIGGCQFGTYSAVCTILITIICLQTQWVLIFFL